MKSDKCVVEDKQQQRECECVTTQLVTTIGLRNKPRALPILSFFPLYTIVFLFL